MKREYVIITDGNSDLPKEFAQEHQIELMMMGFSIDGEEYLTSSNPREMDSKEFYAKMRAGADTKTVALEPEVIRSYMKKHLDQGKDVLYLAFSSGLSGTCQNGVRVAQELSEEYPDAKIRVVDSLAASLGQGLMVYYAAGLKKDGKTLDEVAADVEENRLKFCHYFTVDDLNFLHRGGRVSKTTAIVGSLLGIKPVLHVDDAGKLIAIGKVRGRKQSLDALVDKMGGKLGQNKNEMVFISHGDCEQDAEYVAGQVKKKFGIKSFLLNYIGSSIGSHSGPGTVALFFIGDSRTEEK